MRCSPLRCPIHYIMKCEWTKVWWHSIHKLKDNVIWMMLFCYFSFCGQFLIICTTVLFPTPSQHFQCHFYEMSPLVSNSYWIERNMKLHLDGGCQREDFTFCIVLQISLNVSVNVDYVFWNLWHALIINLFPPTNILPN